MLFRGASRASVRLVSTPSLRVQQEELPMEELSVQGDLTYTEYPIKIIDALTRVTKNKVIEMWKVKWSHHVEDKAT